MLDQIIIEQVAMRPNYFLIHIKNPGTIFFSGDIYFALTIRYINWNDTVLENMSRICIKAC